MSKVEKKFDEISIGCDGEGFLVNANNEVVPVVGLLGGKKGAPLACEGGGFLEDCVAWEINPEPVTESQGRTVFIENVQSCIDAVRRRAVDLDLEVDISPTKLFKKRDLASEQASISGCSTSFDCWQLRQLDPVDLSLTNYRFASGDIHVGFPWAEDEDDIYSRVNVARILDVYFGLTEVAHFPRSKRSQFYGKSGIHRPTPYGVESKTAGNYWMETPERIGWAFDAALSAVKTIQKYRKDKGNPFDGINREGMGQTPMLNSLAAQVPHARDKWDRKEAANILSNFNIPSFPG